jgi:putative NADPH-quinone reductase
VKVLLVSAHPLAGSYTAAVRAAAVRGLEAAGHMVDVADLDA